MKTLHSLFLLPVIGLVGCGMPDGAQINDATPQDLGASSAIASGELKACWDGVVTPRPAQDAIPSAALAVKYDAWRAAMVDYRARATTFNATVSEHAAGFSAVASQFVGKPCMAHSDCVTGAVEFPGFCRLYYVHGQCGVHDLHPVQGGPVAPAQPDATCADFTCGDANYQCEKELTTSGIACVLQRCGGGHSGGGNGGSGSGDGGKKL